MEREKHIKYFRRNLTVLPSAYTPYDSSHTSLVYFSIAGLKLLGVLESHTTRLERAQWIDWTYRHLVPSGEGFRGSLSHQLSTNVKCSLNDPANLASTFFCLSILALLEDHHIPQRIDRFQIMNYVRSCQRPTGEFTGVSHPSTGPFGDNDPRYTYVAAAIRRFLQFDGSEAEDIDINTAVRYIRSTKAYDGGLGDKAGSESHAGLTYCGLAALQLLGKLDGKEWQSTAVWLAKRQISSLDVKSGRWVDEETGGFNGRINKMADTCYSFWTCASLSMLGHLDFIDSNQATDFLLRQCQDGIIGGFVKAKGSHADPLHSYLGLAALSINAPQLNMGDFDPALCLPRHTVLFIDSLDWAPS
jgi:geranylgeranyl transferase type-1 subunit beta